MLGRGNSRDLALTQSGHKGRVLICGLGRCCNNGMNGKLEKGQNLGEKSYRELDQQTAKEEKKDWGETRREYLASMAMVTVL